MLSPFFQSLPVLPYAFLAILTDGQLEDLLECTGHEETLKLPTSGVIACARYHIGEYHKVIYVYDHPFTLHQISCVFSDSIVCPTTYLTVDVLVQLLN